MFSGTGALITAYKQNIETEKRINELNSIGINNICVVETSEDPNLYNNIKDKAIIIQFYDSPGSSSSNWKSHSNVEKYNVAGNHWRANYLAARILFAIERGLKHLYRNGSEFVLHIHSDTVWKSEEILLRDIEQLKKYNAILIGDLAEPFENGKLLPPRMNFCPEGIIFNLNRCNQVGYWNFEKIYESDNSYNEHINENHYHCLDWIGIEPHFGCWAFWLLFNKNILSNKDEVPDFYYQQMITRMCRHHHGNFEHLNNIPGFQT